jgi:hypothetical protein
MQSAMQIKRKRKPTGEKQTKKVKAAAKPIANDKAAPADKPKQEKCIRCLGKLSAAQSSEKMSLCTACFDQKDEDAKQRGRGSEGEGSDSEVGGGLLLVADYTSSDSESES